MSIANNLKTYFKPDELKAYGDFYKVQKPLVIQNNYQTKHLVLVTSLNPTLTGEGKTTVTIGLNDCLNYFGYKSLAVLRQPSMGPVFGAKGGATGSGECAVANSMKVNLGLTNDFFKLEQANNLIMTAIENNWYHKKAPLIDPQQVFWNRCVDLNDRSLKAISYQVKNETVHSQFVITAASKIMALFCLAKSPADFQAKLQTTLLGFSANQEPVYLKQFKLTGAIMHILQEAMQPNVVFSKQHNPILMHGGPFANIAHGCNSLMATYHALNQADYVFTEAGFGSELGAEKFFNIKCRVGKLKPSLVVLAVTLKAVKHHGSYQMVKNNWEQFITNGFEQVKYHWQLLTKFQVPVVIVINKFSSDKAKELALLTKLCEQLCPTVVSNMWQEGPATAKAVCQLILQNVTKNGSLKYTYPLSGSIHDKITAIATQIYGAKAVKYEPIASQKIQQYEKHCHRFFICNAKTPFSITHDKSVWNVPKTPYTLKISDVDFNFAANFVIPILSNVFLMPGLSVNPNFTQFTYEPEQNQP